LGTKRHNLVDQNGIPLALLLSSANEHDTRSHNKVWCSFIVKPPSKTEIVQNACEDKAYDDSKVRNWLSRHRYVVHIPYRQYKNSKKENKKKQIGRKKKSKRWVVERTGRWHNLFRRLKIRYEKKPENYLAFVEFSNAIICYRSCHRKI